MEIFTFDFFGFPIWKLLLLTFGGMFAGYINIIAGGGSLLTIPLLIFVGLPTGIANGTNRVGIFLQNVSAVWRLNSKQLIKWRLSISFILPVVFGSGVGAYLATIMNPEAFDIAVGILMLLILSTLFLNPEQWKNKVDTIKLHWWRFPVFFLIGIYGGFLQAGVGFLLLAALVPGLGFNIVSANAMKLLLTLYFTAIAIVIFLIQDQIVWIAGLFLAAGNIIGSFAGIKFLLKINPNVIRWIIIIAVLATAGKLFGLWTF
jgi:uncharacterized protein